MQTLVKQYAAKGQRIQGVPLQIRVGLNSGEVVLLAIGNDLHMAYRAVGQTTHLAACMEQMAMPGSILITPVVLQLAEGHIQVNALGPVPIQGLHAPVEIFRRLDRRGLGVHPPRYISLHLRLRCRLRNRQVRRAP
jgi:class 3 adenylate cyclase